MPDPIVEAPSAVWYVRTNAGAQFGPARGDMMRQWLDERRVGPDYLVWREGWPEWKRASAVFARLAAMSAAGGKGAQVAAAPKTDDDWVEAIIESQSHPATHNKPRPKKSPNNNLLMIISFVVVLLGAILVVVVIIAARRQAKNNSQNLERPASEVQRLAAEHGFAGIRRAPGIECQPREAPFSANDLQRAFDVQV